MHSYRALIPFVTLALTLAANASPVGYYSNTYATREVSSPATYDMRDIFSPAEDFPKARDSGNLLLREVPTVPNEHPPPYEEPIAAPHSTAEKTPPKIDTIEKPVDPTKVEPKPPAAPVPSGAVKGTQTGWSRWMSKINPTKVKPKPPAAPVPSGAVKGTQTGWSRITSKINPKVKEYAKNTAIVGLFAGVIGGVAVGSLYGAATMCPREENNPERRSPYGGAHC
ncbi:hypothetical protein GG344DRAFT_77950 [Lentinula edodes]|nr:hypothetical protein GG344DRAFT_77950 [Lentinula edodes]